VRTSARYAGAAVLAAVLLVGGCGGGDGGGDGPDAGNSPAARDSAGPTADAGDRTPDGGGVEGTWSTKDGADALVLSVSGNQAALLGETACSGPVDTASDPVTFTLTCTDGSTDRTEGTVKSLDGKSLTVAWKSGATDTFTKMDVPTEIGDLPTDLKDLGDLGDLGDLPRE